MKSASLGLVIALVVCHAFGGVRFYPAVVDERPNLMEGRKWTYQTNLEHAAFEDGLGGPTGTSRTYRVVSRKAASAYVDSDGVKVEPGRTYLEGAWLRFANAKALVRTIGFDTAINDSYEPRMYAFGGFNSFLEPFFSDSTKRHLGGDPAAWKLVYRTATYPDTLRGNQVRMSMGLYLAEGDVTFADPFLIDITGLETRPLVVEVKGGRPVRSLAVSEADTHDVIWTKRFERPVTEFREVIEKRTDFLRGKDNNKMDAYRLEIEYGDGAHERLECPLGGSFKERS